MTDPELLALWFKALEEPVGLVLSTNDSARLRAKLYEVRKPYPELQKLFLALGPDSPKTTVLILHKEIKVSNDAEEI